jgi:hypothetical protein
MALAGLRRWLFQRRRKWAFEEGRRNPGAATVFIHIPKCAGIAFVHDLDDALRSKSTRSGFDHSLFGAFDQFETIGPETRASIYGPADSIPRNLELVAGHFAVSTARRFYPEANYCTVLREPKSRLLSHWLYWRQFSDEDLTVWGVPWRDRVLRARLPLVDFLCDPEIACQTDNLTLRMLLWPDCRIPANGFVSEGRDKALLKGAIAILQNFGLIGLIENPDLSRNVEKWIGAPFVLKRMNETRPAYAEFPVNLERELTAEAWALLKKRSGLDLILWKEVLKRQRPSEDSDAIGEAVFRSTLDRHKVVQLDRRSFE